MSFEPGQTLLRTSVAVLLDDIPEDTESFTVSLVSPTGGAELGQNNTVRVDILANDDAYGIIEFSPVSHHRNIHSFWLNYNWDLFWDMPHGQYLEVKMWLNI